MTVGAAHEEDLRPRVGGRTRKVRDDGRAPPAGSWRLFSSALEGVREVRLAGDSGRRWRALWRGVDTAEQPEPKHAEPEADSPEPDSIGRPADLIRTFTARPRVGVSV